jgi:competence protein ComEC
MLVDGAEVWPHHLYPGPIPLWLTASFYAVFLAWLVHPPWYRHGRHLLPLAVGWLCLVAGVGLWSRGSDALRITFVAVGHGGCVVLEMPDDRVLLYDAGSLRGPEVGARTIAPFLWSRRISRIDTVILSHADLDHFNGLVGLLERFAVGQVLCADSFVASPKPGVQRLRNELARRRVPLQTAQAGDRLTTRDVTLEVLHPPATYREGNDNARSLILYVQHGPHRVLLTGDLEGAGLERLLSQPPRRVDVLQAPHHGSESLDIEGLLRWCQPRCVLSCQGPTRSGHLAGSAYNRRGVPFYDTHRLGAITLLSQADGLWLERYHSAERLADEPLEPIPENDDGG